MSLFIGMTDVNWNVPGHACSVGDNVC